MEKVRKISKRYYCRQIVACFLVSCLFFNVPAALATPTGPDVVAGSASVGQAGSTTTVTMGTARAVINWDSLNTGSSEILQFLKDAGGFAVLNRVMQGGATRFDGSLFGNQGHIIIVNPHGIVFGPTALVQAYQFTASGLEILDTDFMTGYYQFFPVNGIGSVSNYGQISAEQVALIGKQVLNAGVIRSPGGYVLMAAGDRVFLGQDGSDVVVQVDAVTVVDPTDPGVAGMGDVINEGTVEAAGGKIVLAAGDTFSRAIEGLDSLSLAVESGAGRVGQFGTLSADGVEGDGGSITLTAGDAVALSGDSVTTANAGANGDGGEVIVYSPETALFREGARIEAKGGAESGNGGFIEVSGKNHVEVFGTADASATNGTGGLFFIDPFNITVQDSAPGSLDPLAPNFTANASSSTVSDDAIEGQLDGGTDVLIRTADALVEPSQNGDITQNVEINKTAGGEATLVYDAAGDIVLNAGIVSTSGELNVDLRANSASGGTPSGTGSVNVGAAVTTNGGDFTSSGINFDNTGGVITTDAVAADGAININHTGTVTLGADLNPGGGPMSGTSTSINVASNLAEIQDAIDVAASGAAVSVAAGTYNENLYVNKSDLTLSSKLGENVTLTANTGVVVDVDGGGDGFTLGGADGEGFTVNSQAGTTFLVQLENAPQNVEISWNGLDTTGNASMGISVGDAGASGLNINNNTFTADDVNPSIWPDGAIWGPLVSGATVSDNEFTASSGIPGYAIQFSGLTDSTISQNEITGYGQGISVFHGEGVSNVLIEKNEITGCTNGIRFGEYKATAGPDGDITSVTVRNNKVTGGDIGIRLNPDGAHVLANEIHVYENDLSGNTYGANNQLNNGTVLDAEGNWWGAADGPTHASNPGGSGVAISDNVDYSPWLGIGADSDPAIGFQMASPMDWWSNDYIQDAIDAASPGDSVCVPAKTYSESVNVNKGLAGLNFMGAASSEIDGQVTLTNDSDNWDGGVLGINTENENLTLNPVTDTGSHGLTLDAGTAIIGLDGDVTIGEDLTLLSDTVVAADKTLFSFAGHVILAPDEAITGQGALTIRADEDILLGVGDPLNPETGSPGNVTANGNLTLDAGDSIYAHGTLTTQDGSVGHINLSASDSTIHLFGNVTADVTDGGDIFVHNRSEVAAGVTLQAGHDVTIDALMTGLGDLTIEAGAQPGDVDGQIQAVGISMPATTYALSLTQTPSLDMAGFPIVFNSDTTNLDATSNAGSVTEKAADRWLSIAADADTFISLDDSDAGGDITTGALTANSGDILIKSDLGKVNVDGPINAGMDVKIAGNEGPDGLDDAIFLNYSDPGPTVQAGRDIWLANNTRAAGGVELDAGQDVRVGWDGDDGPFDPTPGTEPWQAKNLTGDGSLGIFANRHITLGGPVEAAGDLVLIADNDFPFVKGGNLWAMKSLTTTNGGVIFGHGENIQVDGIVDSAGPLLMFASENITLNDDAEADLNMQLYADWNGATWDFENGAGNLSTKNLTTYGGEIDAKGHNIGVDGAIDSATNVKLYANDDVTVTGNIDAGGTIDIWSDDTTTYLGGDRIEAVLDITLHDNTVLNGGDQTIDSQSGLLMTDDGANVNKSTAGNVNFGGDDGIQLGGNVTGSGMIAGNTMTFEDDVTANGSSAQEIDADAGKLVTIDGVNIDKFSDTTLTLGGAAGIELGGNVTGGGLTAASSIIMEDDVTANGTGDQRFDAGDGKLVTENAVDIDKTTLGNLNLGGGAGIELGGDVEGTGLTEFDAITFEDDVTADGTDAAADQRLEAYNGSLVTLNAVDIDKTTSGRLYLGGNEGIELGGNVTGTGIVFGGGIILTDDVTANGTGAAANQRFDAYGGFLITNDGVDIDKTTVGNLNLGGNQVIQLGGNVRGTGLIASDAITFEDDVTAVGSGAAADQLFDAGDGKLVTQNAVDIRKITLGNLNLGGAAGIELGGDVRGPGMTSSHAITFEDDVTANGTAAAANQRFDAGAGTLHAQGTITKTTEGDLTLGGDELLDLDDTVDVQQGNLFIEDSFAAGGDLIASQNLYIRNPADTPVNGEFDGMGLNANQKVQATAGNLSVNPAVMPDSTEPYLTKTTDGDLLLKAGHDAGVHAHVTVTDGKLDIEAGSTLSVFGNLKSTDDMTLTSYMNSQPVGNISLHGNAESTGGSVTMKANGREIHLFRESWNQTQPWQGIKAGEDIKLLDDTFVRYSDATLDAGRDAILAAEQDLKGDGTLTVKAGRHILLGVFNPANPEVGSPGNVSAGFTYGGGETPDSDLDLEAVGDVWAHGQLKATGDITISSSDSTTHLMTDLVEATGNVNLENNTEAADGILIHAVTGDVIVGVETETVDPLDYPGIPGLLPGVYTDTYLEGYGALTVEAGSDVIVGGELSTDGAMLVTAGDNISVGSASADGDMDMTATTGNITAGRLFRIYDLDPVDGDLVFKGGDLDVLSTAAGHNMALTAAGSISFRNAKSYSKWTGTAYEGGNMTMTAEAGDITAGVVAPTIWAGGPPLSEVVTVTQGGDIGANGDMTLLADNDVKAKYVNWGTWSGGSVWIEAGHDIVIGEVLPTLKANVYNSDGELVDWAQDLGDTQEDVLNVHKGGYARSRDDMTLLAGNDIKVKHAESRDGDLLMTAELGDILIGGPAPHAIEIDGGEYGTIVLDKGGFLSAEDGAITLDAGRDISLKMADAADDITMTAVDNITLRTNQIKPGQWGRDDRTESYYGDIRLHALNGDISIGGDVDVVEPYELIAGFIEEEPELNGGVSLIADNGKIFSPGGDDDTLSAIIAGYSNQAEDIGVELPEDPDQKAAIVIISDEDLKLGSEAELYAAGVYDETGAVDDRAAIKFLDIDGAQIGGVPRRAGDPFDAAVYLQSTGGDVDVSSMVVVGSVDFFGEEFEVTPQGAMVIDAFDTVTFDTATPPDTFFQDSLADGMVGTRLEVASRLTEWLFQAVDGGTLPFAGGGGPFPDGYAYVLRGAGLGNPAITDGRAWVLDNPVPPAPLYTETGEEAEEQAFAEGGCPALMEWLAAEIGITEEEIRVYVAYAFAYSTDLQPCEACARLYDAATVLDDESLIVALGQVVNEVVAVPAPPSEEQMAMIASVLAAPEPGTRYASAAEWVDALVAYVSILSTEMGWTPAEAVAFANKYVAPVTDTGDVSLIAYVQTRLAGLGG